MVVQLSNLDGDEDSTKSMREVLPLGDVCVKPVTT